MVYGLNGFKYYWVHLPYYRELLYYFKKLLIYRDVGAAQEMMYWKAELGPRGWTPIGKDIYHRIPDIESALQCMRNVFSVEGRDLKVLEIGPGPRSGLAEGYDKGEYDLVGG